MEDEVLELEEARDQVNSLILANKEKTNEIEKAVSETPSRMSSKTYI
jgi:hypothetical protein